MLRRNKGKFSLVEPFSFWHSVFYSFPCGKGRGAKNPRGNVMHFRTDFSRYRVESDLSSRPIASTQGTPLWTKPCTNITPCQSPSLYRLRRISTKMELTRQSGKLGASVSHSFSLPALLFIHHPGTRHSLFCAAKVNVDVTGSSSGHRSPKNLHPSGRIQASSFGRKLALAPYNTF